MFCLVLAAALVPASARSADDAVCQEFALAMLGYVKVNASRHCTGMGPQWSTRPAEHLSWCKGVSAAAVKTRLAESKAFIDQCGKAGTGKAGSQAGAPPAGPMPAPEGPPMAGPSPASAAEGALPKPTFP